MSGVTTTSHPARINEQLLGYWQSIKTAKGMPSESAIDVDALSQIWDSCFLVRVESATPLNFTYITLGKALIHAYGDDWTNKTVCEALVYPHPEPLLKAFEKIVQTKEPLTDDSEFKNSSGLLVKYRSCLVPLSRDGGSEIAYILGGMKWKSY